MKRKSLFILFFVLVLVLGSTITGFAQETDSSKVFKLTMINKTDGPVYISLVKGPNVYFLTALAGQEVEYTVPEGVYEQRTYACGRFGSGTLDIYRQTRLVFPDCSKDLPNYGEPSMEKIRLTDPPPAEKDYQYQAQ